MGRQVFISYRKGLHGEEAATLHAALKRRMRSGAIYTDADDGAAESGWSDALATAEPTQAAMLVLASESLIDQRGDAGMRLLHMADDPMRQELLTALERRIEIIPVIVDGANPLSVARLPEELWPIFLNPAARLRQETLEQDVDGIAARLSEALKPQPFRLSVGAAAAAAVVALVVGGGVAAALISAGDSRDPAYSVGAASASAEVETASIEANGRIEALEDELAAAQAALDEERAEIETERAALRAEVAAAEEALRVARMDETEQLTALSDEKDALAAQLAALNTELETTVDALEAELAATVGALNDEILAAREAAETAEARLADERAAREAADARAADAIDEAETAEATAEAALRAVEEERAGRLAAEAAVVEAARSGADTETTTAAAVTALEAEAKAAREAARAAEEAAAEAAQREQAAINESETAALALAAAESALEAAEAAAAAAEERAEARLAALAPALIELDQADEADRVARAQTALGALGYEVGSADGVAGSETRAALARFQGAVGLPETGALDDPTFDALIVAERYAAARLDAAPQSAAPDHAAPEPEPAAASAADETHEATQPTADGSAPEADAVAPGAAPAPTPRPERAEAEPEPAEPAGPEPLSVFRECGDCPEMVAMPGGEFLMGSPNNETGRVGDEGPRRRVQMAPFAMSQYETTVAEWGACVEDGYCRPIDVAGRDPNEPIVGASWADITGDGVEELGYLAWLDAQTDGAPYRLPSEAEWEYAARAGSSSAYAFGDDPAALGDYAWYDGNSDGRAAPVGGKSPNAWGLFDMHGNVWEWVQDCWHPGYGGAPRDGSAWMSAGDGDCARAVVRGGAWNDLPWGLRAAYRGWSAREQRRGDVGFRVARSL